LHPTDEREYRTPARRPKFSALANVRIKRAGLAPMPPLVEAVKEYIVQRNKLIAGGN
jgi:dTDP-4-dehydrorhamnose reductase